MRTETHQRSEGDKRQHGSAEKKAHRLERWLHAMKGAAAERGIPASLRYDDDRHDKMALSLLPSSGLLELLVHRTKRGAVLILCADGEGAVARVHEELGELHTSVSRLYNARRKFTHRFTRMLSHLNATYAARATDFPADKLARLKTLCPEATAMVGIEGLFHERHHEEEEILLRRDAAPDVKRREARRYPTRYAARIGQADKGQAARSALFSAGDGCFRVPSEHADQALAAGASAAAAAAAAAVILPNLPARQDQPPGDAGSASSFDCDLLSIGCDSIDLFSDCNLGDVGGCDLPDCGSCDLPDCGGLDCSF